MHFTSSAVVAFPSRHSALTSGLGTNSRRWFNIIVALRYAMHTRSIDECSIDGECGLCMQLGSRLQVALP
jgi:hypothetical protein